MKAKDAVGWLIDYAGSMQDSLNTTWSLATTGGATGVARRSLDESVLEGIPTDVGVSASDNPATEAARKAIMESIRNSCSVPLSEALDIQAKHSAGFTVTSYCKEGSIGADRARTMLV